MLDKFAGTLSTITELNKVDKAVKDIINNVNNN